MEKSSKLPQELPDENAERDKWFEVVSKAREDYNRENKDKPDFVPAP
jgi:hypothetical protein